MFKTLAAKLNQFVESRMGFRVVRPHQYSRLFELLRELRANELQPKGDSARKFTQFVLHHLFASQAQLFQDLWVLFELNEMREGFFVEFGAGDGRWLSNSWLLESEYSWRGILVEPNFAMHKGLAANRRATIDGRCVYSKSGERLKFLVTGDPEFSTIAEFVKGDHNAESRKRHSMIYVESVSLHDLLDANGAPETIDYLSIDTEGSEWEILRAYDFSRRINCISVEHNNSRNREPIRDLLVSKGFVRRMPELSAWDDWYIRRDVLRADLASDLPR